MQGTPIPAYLPFIEIISLISSISSLILAVGAIWLSITFYKMSSAASNATTEAAKGIGASVERLEKLFDKLYSDTFSMMRDTVSDMRKHMWPSEDTEIDKTVEEVEKRADEKINEIKKAVEEQLSELLHHQKIADDNVASLSSEMRHLIERAITTSRSVESEAREETLREYILRELRILRHRNRKPTVSDLIERLRDKFPFDRIIVELYKMRDEDIIWMSDKDIAPDTIVRFKIVTSSDNSIEDK
ncbi:MAG: hypothetical protein ACYC6G_02305 [Desulfobaccales bacterium]